MNIFKRAYFKLLMFKRGICFNMLMSFKCNLDCEYCALKDFGKLRPVCKNEMSVDDWLIYIRTFPIKIKEVSISGGEPTMRKDLPLLVNALIAEGYFVHVFSNLYNPSLLMQINPSPRFIIYATYHHDDDIVKFEGAYNLISKHHQILVDEIGYRVLDYSRTKPLLKRSDIRVTLKNKLYIAPDGRILTKCSDFAKYYAHN